MINIDGKGLFNFSWYRASYMISIELLKYRSTRVIKKSARNDLDFTRKGLEPLSLVKSRVNKWTISVATWSN